MHAPRSSCPSLQDPELATSKIAETIALDLNDPRLLIDHVQASATSRNIFGRSHLRKAGRGAFTKNLSHRYNISNDEAYDLLKENHQSKVRSMLGNVAVEHSLPAVRLQWPFVSHQDTSILAVCYVLLHLQSIKPSWISRMPDHSTGRL